MSYRNYSANNYSSTTGNSWWRNAGRSSAVRNVVPYGTGASSPAHTLLLVQSPPYVSGYYICHVCWERGSGPHYHCPDCQLDVHVSCLASHVGPGSFATATTTHFSHFEHPLLLKAASGGAGSSDIVGCDGCGDTVVVNNSTNGAVYRCSRCDFDLCPFCTRSPRYVRHPSHRHVLVLSPLLDHESRSCRCDGCGQYAGVMMMYRCTTCNFDLHQSCLRLPLKPVSARHPEHPLTLVWRGDDKLWSASPYTCDACGHEGRDCWAYTCSICRVFLHPNCTKVNHNLPRSATHHRQMEPKVINRSSSSSVLQGAAPTFGESPTASSVDSVYNRRHHSTSTDYYNGYGSTTNNRPYTNGIGMPSYNTRHGDPLYTSFVDGGYASDTGDSLAQALSSRVHPMNSRDAEAVDRVMNMIRHNGIY